MCVCVRERDRERKREGERETERECLNCGSEAKSLLLPRRRARARKLRKFGFVELALNLPRNWNDFLSWNVRQTNPF